MTASNEPGAINKSWAWGTVLPIPCVMEQSGAIREILYNGHGDSWQGRPFMLIVVGRTSRSMNIGR